MHDQTESIRRQEVAQINAAPGSREALQAKPTSPELQPLHNFIGSWEQQVVAKPAEWTPDKTVATCPVTVNWILGGRMIEHRCIWSPGNIHGLCLMAYDAEKGEYRQWYFDSNREMPRGENRGSWDEATKTFTWKGHAPNGITTAQSHRFIDNDTQEWSLVFKDSSGKVCLDTEAKAKQKSSVTISDPQGRGAKAPPPEMKLLEQCVGTWREANVSKVAEWTPKETRGKPP